MKFRDRAHFEEELKKSLDRDLEKAAKLIDINSKSKKVSTQIKESKIPTPEATYERDPDEAKRLDDIERESAKYYDPAPKESRKLQVVKPQEK